MFSSATQAARAVRRSRPWWGQNTYCSPSHTYGARQEARSNCGDVEFIIVTFVVTGKGPGTGVAGYGVCVCVCVCVCVPNKIC